MCLFSPDVNGFIPEAGQRILLGTEYQKRW